MSDSDRAPGKSVPAETHIGRVVLRVADLGRAVRFYTEAIGFELQERAAGEAHLGVPGARLLGLIELPGAPPKPEWATGLYHFAIRVPSRPDLGRVLRHLIDSGTGLQGASDHLVSEALYLADPDRNGIEIYRDRPRADWPMQGDRIRMGTNPLDADGVLEEAEREGRAFSAMPEGTSIGHIHLQVGDLATTEAFYVGGLGFDVVAKMGSALFVSAGGYHHHIGMNTWTSLGRGPVSGTAGLEEYEVVFPHGASRDEAGSRVGADGKGNGDRGPTVRDPAGNTVRLSVGT